MIRKRKFRGNKKAEQQDPVQEGKIQLLDGRVLDCYSLEQPQGEVDNHLSLDTTGVYLSLKRPNKANMVKDNQDEDEKLLEKLFLDNAFVLLNNRERILSDSRMFLCPLPIRNGLAYTGTSGFHHPTLGIYIEFWLNCPAATIMKENREKWLLWHISGSPLSGSNRCSLINPQGETTCEQVISFKDIWVPFMEINTRYDEAKSMYDAYTLRQVLSILEKGITGSVLLIIFRSLISLCFITCLIRISFNLKKDQKNRPHGPKIFRAET